MITEIERTALNRIVFAVGMLDLAGFFSTLRFYSKFFSNYDFHLVVEKRCEISTVDVDSIDGVKPFSIQGPVSEVKNNMKLTVAQIDNNGLSFFPEKQYDEIPVLQIQSGFEEYRINVIKCLVTYLIKKIEENDIGIDIGEYNKNRENFEEELEYLLSESPSVPIIGYDFTYSNDAACPQITDNDTIECSPSMFYLINENVAEHYSGGMWSDLANAKMEEYEFYSMNEDIDEPQFSYEFELNLLDSILDNTKQALYLEARLFFEGQPLVEQILKFGKLPSDLINRKQRKIVNGVYCPIGKSELIAGLDVSLPIKEYLGRIIRYIETRPFIEEKRSVCEHILSELQKKGYYEKIQTSGLTKEDIGDSIIAFKKICSEYLQEVREHGKKTEAGIFQIIERMNSWKKQLPVFLGELDVEHRARYIDNIKRICELCIPISQEEQGLYQGIIDSFGTLTGSIIASIINPNKKIDVTVPKLADNEEIKPYLDRLPSAEKDRVRKFSIKYGQNFNDVRHEDKKCDFFFFHQFVKETQAVIEIFVRNKHKYTT